MQDAFLEQDEDRLVRRIARVSAGELSNREIGKLVAGDVTVLSDLPTATKQAVGALMAPGSSARGRLEKMVGPTLDFVPVAYLTATRRVADAVARVATMGRKPLGTGVLVSPRLFMTNHHVLVSAIASARAILQFRYELDANGAPCDASEFRLDPDSFFWTSPADELDVTIIAVGQAEHPREPLESFGWCHLSAGDDKHAEGDHVTLVQHPEGDYKQVALRENWVIGRGAQGVTLHYGADTLSGSSGSPVFNDQLDLVALHHAGGPKIEAKLSSGIDVPDESNEGIRISAIVAELNKARSSLEAPQLQMLAEAIVD